MKKVLFILALVFTTTLSFSQTAKSNPVKAHKIYAVAFTTGIQILKGYGSLDLELPKKYVAQIIISGMSPQTLSDSTLQKKLIIEDYDIIREFTDNGWDVVTGIYNVRDERAEWVFCKEAIDVKSAVTGLRIKDYDY